MGECVYYIKAQFPKGKAKKVFPQIKKFFQEGLASENWWQDHRTGISSAEFWLQFEKQFPNVTEYLKEAKLFGGDNNNGLAGNLDFANDKDDIDRMSCDEDVLCYEAMIWHMASWEHLAAYLKKKFGASKVVWDNEENGCGSVDNLQLYDYQGIVTRLLEHKMILPTLLGLHDDLDALIEQVSKG